MDEHGAIRDRRLLRQVKNFSGLRIGAWSPTDIDAFYDLKDRVFIFIEAKHGDSEMPTGQRLALERLCDACATPQRRTIALQARHDAPAGDDIDMGALAVKRYYTRGAWRVPKSGLTLAQALRIIVRKWLPIAKKTDYTSSSSQHLAASPRGSSPGVARINRDERNCDESPMA